jgi:hypothetical protein
MADLIIACARAGRPRPYTAEDLRCVALALTPDASAPREPRLAATAGVLVAVAAPAAEGVWVEGDDVAAGLGDGGAEGATGGSAGTKADGAGSPRPAGAVCVGGLFGDHRRWAEPGSEPPDGTYALARWDGATVELVSDICASRTLWYALTDDAFLASTSQRALVALLGSFMLEEAAVSWALSAGTLGPELSWDARVRRVAPDTRVLLDRAAWRLDVRQTPVVFGTQPGDDTAQVARLRAAIDATCAALDVAPDEWVLTLSGGCDTRVLLAFLVANGLRPRCVTWTTRASLREPLSDVSIARVLARRYRVEHEALLLDDGDVDLDTALTRFVAADVGRNDEVGGYLDGFAVWRRLTAAGVSGVIRGDEALGDRRGPGAVEDLIMRASGSTAADYPRDHVIRTLGLAPQSRPVGLQPRPGEDLRQYRVRLNQGAYVPTTLAGLNGPKARYVEIVNPLLSRRVVGVARTLSPRMLDRERAFLAIISEISPAIPTARFSSTSSVADVLAGTELVELVVRELTSPRVARILGGDAPVRVLGAMATPAAASGLGARAREVLKEASLALPIRVAARLKPGWKGPEPLSGRMLGFRTLLASRTVARLEEDARALRPDARG